MKMENAKGEAVYYNIVEKHGNIRYIITAASGQLLIGRDTVQKSRSFTTEHGAESFLKRHGYKAV